VDELQTLINEFNAAARQQLTRAAEIYRLAGERHAFVVFASGVTWGRHSYAASGSLPQHQAAKLDQTITVR
jgi:hypothetical protein